MLGGAARAERVPEEVRLVPESIPRWGLRNITAAVTSLFGARDYWYAENIVLIDTAPAEAQVDLFYVRANFQKMYVRARSPVLVTLPSRISATNRDALIIRVSAPGFSTGEESYKIGKAPEELVVTLEPVPNALVLVSHAHIGGRTTLTLRMTERPEFRVMKSRGSSDFSLVLAETASRLEDSPLPSGGLVRELAVTQLGEDLVVRVGTDNPDVEVRSKDSYDAIREEYLFILDLSAPGSRPPTPERIRRDVAGARFSLNDPCNGRFERTLRDTLDPDQIGRGIRSTGTLAQLYRREVMLALGRLDQGRVRTVGGERFRTGSALELELAMQNAAFVEGYMALLGAYARTTADPPTALRSLLVPDMAPAGFAPLYKSAETVWKACRRAGSR
jgi:hypothetical protein